VIRGAVAVGMLVLTTGCHQYQTVNDITSVVGTQARITLTPEARATNARRLGGVVMEIDGVVSETRADSIAIKAQTVRFADLGSVPFGAGELWFASKDVSGYAKQVLNPKRSWLVAGLTVGVAGILGGVIASATGSGSGTVVVPPTPR
jgi:hypothetical protein